MALLWKNFHSVIFVENFVNFAIVIDFYSDNATMSGFSAVLMIDSPSQKRHNFLVVPSKWLTNRKVWYIHQTNDESESDDENLKMLQAIFKEMRNKDATCKLYFEMT